MLRFDGKVVIVTGAGGGLGREYAILFASRGASVVVNDLGGSSDGGGKSTSMADKVVEEIHSAGGNAVPNYDSVENGDSIVQTAVSKYGRIDIVVNNAGILRDKSFGNMSDLDWDLIHKVHLKGSFSVTKAAWPYMRRQNYGRIIMTSSTSGIFGNFGQSNYSSAKMALIGLSNSLAIEGKKHNINSNVVVPVAGSRLTKDILPDDIWQQANPIFVSPLVVWLCHDSCNDSGGVFQAGAGFFGRFQWFRSEGKVIKKSDGSPPSPENLRDEWREITDMSLSKGYSVNQEEMMDMLAKLQQAEVDSTSSLSKKTDNNAKNSMDPRLCRNYEFKSSIFEYSPKTAILYALSVGATLLDSTNLKFLYEGSENFQVLPTFAVVAMFDKMSEMFSKPIPGVSLDLSKLLHGEQYIELFAPFPAGGKLIIKQKIIDLLDKGSAAILLIQVDGFCSQSGREIFTTQQHVFLRDSGGFGGSRSNAAETRCVPVPNRTPDCIVEESTVVDQACLYRLASGDFNPLHIDPEFAKLAGFKQPILHGLATLGFAVRHVLQNFAANDSNPFKAVKCRFTKPVIPGDTLLTEMWKDGDRVHYQTKVKNSGLIVISDAYVDLKPGFTTKINNIKSDQSNLGSTGMKSKRVFDEISARLKSQPQLAKQIAAVFEWVIQKDGRDVGKFVIDLKEVPGSVYEGEPKNKADVTLILSDDDMLELVSGKLNPQQAFMSGKLKLKGKIMLTQKLQLLLKEQSKI